MLNWLNNAVFYEIYPTSFYDANGDGIGDLRGIAQKADYIKSLGIDAVWLNPIYKSPFKDGGYDVADYYTIDKKFGTMDDFDYLVKEFKARNIKIVLDLVVGHTSDKHEWFKKSSRAKRNEYSDYYIWTNSIFEGYDGMIYGLSYRDGGYMKNYYACQPALNFGFNKLDDKHKWKMHYTDERLNPLREDILNIMRFYLDKGIDGFRVDMASSVVKDCAKFNGEDLFNSSEDDMEGLKWFWNKVLGQLRNEYQDKVYIAEWVVPQRSIGMCGFDMDFFTHDTLPFNQLYRNEKGLNLGDYYERGFNYFSENGEGSLTDFIKYIEYLYKILGDKGCFTSPTGTHDEIRMPTGKSDDMIKCIFAFLLTYKQIPFIYYGDEIGIEHNFYVSKDGGGKRTGARTPMQWTEEKGRGFSAKKSTYLPVSDKKKASVAAQEKDDNSILNTVRKLIKIKKQYSCFNVGAEQKFIEENYPAVFTRKDENYTAIIMINPSNKSYEKIIDCGKVLLLQNANVDGKRVTLKPQSFIIAVK